MVILFIEYIVNYLLMERRKCITTKWATISNNCFFMKCTPIFFHSDSGLALLPIAWVVLTMCEYQCALKVITKKGNNLAVDNWGYIKELTPDKSALELNIKNVQCVHCYLRVFFYNLCLYNSAELNVFC